MLDARVLSDRGAPHGAAVMADLQEAGRGRVASRPWKAEKGQNLLFTLLLRYPDIASIPPALTLRVGLALAEAVERLAPALAGSLRVKWPNDVMLPVGGAYRKTAGILAQGQVEGQALEHPQEQAQGIVPGDGQCLYVGVGVNVHQTAFPDELKNKAGSIALALGPAGLPEDARFRLLEIFLERLHADIEGPAAFPWRERLEERLYLKGREVRFIAGAADAGRVVEGLLSGIGGEGELLIRTAEGIEAFVTGELEVW
jgi:BirA family biotin operon repressor/biotin-[acetyl-CoA-carboxylase] ligase